MTDQSLLFDISDEGVARVTLNRPDVHNAFDDRLIARMQSVFAELADRDDIRAVVLAAAGDSFSAGADLEWMTRTVGQSYAENVADAHGMARLLHAIQTLDKPVIARVQGSAYGGGVGLVAASDIAIAAAPAKFMLSEVQLGLIPSVISPYVVAAIGARQARRYFLTGERFDAAAACGMGLVHEVVEPSALDGAIDRLLAELGKAGPHALVAAKQLVAAVAGRAVDEPLMAETARRIADLRISPEGREGIAAFLEKRSPAWSAR